MYLKRLELVGFKSFADPTRLEFGPGIMAIVGPNGCGKSNIADAVRWVLGEQNARALRGGKMEDCIFNGTETHRPLGMAEVSITLAECESALGLEFNEVTVTRRVFRSGEGEYLINKTPCRLKDIQRLFMGTGVGTNSYSLMEQGRIDRVLSSRPEDRRSVFEEASGITKFKADKKEALRKLEHTEANLLRLADIIREVKRQIISLQRQAGKARRYQSLQQQLRAIDLFFTRQRMASFDEQLRALDLRRAAIQEREEALESDVRDAEQQADAARAEMDALDREIESLREGVARARAEWEHTRDSAAMNRERIRELAEVSDRDRREAEQAREQAEALRTQLEELESSLARARGERDAAERRWSEATVALQRVEEQLDSAQQQAHALRNESLDLDQRAARRQRELSDLDARERTAAFRREKLAAEQIELRRALEQFEARGAQLRSRLAELQAAADAAAAADAEARARRSAAERRRAELRQTLADLQSSAAARAAQIALLEQPEARADGFPGGARLLLDPPPDLELNRSRVLGALARHIEFDAGLRPAFEAVLRPWLDAVIVEDAGAALDALRALELRRAGPARLLPRDGAVAGAPADGPGAPLLAHLRADATMRPLLERLLAGVRLVDSAADIPSPLPAGLTIVTRSGAVFRGDGPAEFWMPDDRDLNPVARRQQVREWRAEAAALAERIAETKRALDTCRIEEEEAQQATEARRSALDEALRQVAHAGGEQTALRRDAKAAAERVETVAYEMESLGREGHDDVERRARLQQEMDAARARQEEIRSAQAALVGQLRDLEQRRNRALAAATEARIEFGDRRNAVEQMEQRAAGHRKRAGELDELRAGRAAAADDYRRRIAELERASAEAEARLEPLAAETRRQEEILAAARERREVRQAEVAAREQAAREKRAELDGLRRERGAIEVESAEIRTRRQGLIERAGGDYRASAEEIAAAPEPDWSEFGGAPADREALESLVAELRAKIEALGAVNLIAIDEYQELEQRHEFLTREQDDLVRAKQQLLDMIRRINQTTTAMFRETFDKVNENFRVMFERLFGGGSAKLVLVDEDDVLECGIEIIARPPGKRLQPVSLLSGGERTMTAVALLFALYMVRPSPFCLLDELDAALDDANIGRFVSVVRDFVANSQFIIITHNRQTIAAANTLFGVTMEQHGVSKIVSVKFNPNGRPESEPGAPVSAGAADAGAPTT